MPPLRLCGHRVSRPREFSKGQSVVPDATRNIASISQCVCTGVCVQPKLPFSILITGHCVPEVGTMCLDEGVEVAHRFVCLSAVFVDVMGVKRFQGFVVFRLPSLV